MGLGRTVLAAMVELDNPELNWVIPPPCHMTLVHVFTMRSACVFLAVLGKISNIHTHCIVIMALKVNEDTVGSKCVERIK
jgi:hypothetical protein